MSSLRFLASTNFQKGFVLSPASPCAVPWRWESGKSRGCHGGGGGAPARPPWAGREHWQGVANVWTLAKWKKSQKRGETSIDISHVFFSFVVLWIVHVQQRNTNVQIVVVWRSVLKSFEWAVASPVSWIQLRSMKQTYTCQGSHSKNKPVVVFKSLH